MTSARTSTGQPSSDDGLKARVRAYWRRNPNALRHGGGHKPGTREFLDAVIEQRYRAEPCVREIACFPEWRGKQVLEIGCGMGLDALQFALNGARIVAVDLTDTALRVARQNFAVGQADGRFAMADAENLPFPDGSFDLVYSHGVLHHTPDTARAVGEARRVLREGGTAIIMVYHRGSYFVKVLIPWVVQPAVLAGMGMDRSQVLRFGLRAFPKRIRDLVHIFRDQRFSLDRLITLTTDPSSPEEDSANPLSKWYDAESAGRLFEGFREVRFAVRQLYYFPPMPRTLRRLLETRYGWFFYVIARK